MAYYHGGPPGLTRVSPPSITGVAGMHPYGTVGRKDRVYITTDYNAAAIYAVGHPSMQGVVYEVLPVFPLEHDPDCDTWGLSYACRGARILRVLQVSPQLHQAILDMLAGA